MEILEPVFKSSHLSTGLFSFNYYINSIRIYF